MKKNILIIIFTFISYNGFSKEKQSDYVKKTLSKNTIDLNMFEKGIDPDSVLCHYINGAIIIKIKNKLICYYPDKTSLSIKELNKIYNKNSK